MTESGGHALRLCTGDRAGYGVQSLEKDLRNCATDRPTHERHDCDMRCPSRVAVALRDLVQVAGPAEAKGSSAASGDACWDLVAHGVVPALRL